MFFKNIRVANIITGTALALAGALMLLLCSCNGAPALVGANDVTAKADVLLTFKYNNGIISSTRTLYALNPDDATKIPLRGEWTPAEKNGRQRCDFRVYNYEMTGVDAAANDIGEYKRKSYDDNIFSEDSLDEPGRKAIILDAIARYEDGGNKDEAGNVEDAEGAYRAEVFWIDGSDYHILRLSSNHKALEEDEHLAESSFGEYAYCGTSFIGQIYASGEPDDYDSWISVKENTDKDV